MSTNNKMVSLSKDQVTFLRVELANVLDSQVGFTLDEKILAAELIKKLDGRQSKKGESYAD
jgi:hypothetical protein